jgi:hypothetical protein
MQIIEMKSEYKNQTGSQQQYEKNIVKKKPKMREYANSSRRREGKNKDEKCHQYNLTR